jgi:hypothetical protein
MKFYVKLVSVLASLLYCTVSAAAVPVNPIAAALQQNLWTKRDAYDAAHVLMVPLHFAYVKEDSELIGEFRRFVNRFLDDKHREPLGLLTELQFSYLLSRFVVLETYRKQCSPLARRGSVHLTARLVEALRSPAWQWGRPAFTSMFERLKWKLIQSETKPSYLKAIIDEELFAMAIAADLSSSLPVCGLAVPEELRQALDLAEIVFRQEGESTPYGWVFQPGVWRDHPDYQYAGNMDLRKDLEKKVVAGIGVDSSHSARLPLWLRSLQCAAPASKRDLYGGIVDQLKGQLMHVVIETPTEKFPGVRLRNFMTGHNGVYRYGYRTIGEGGGYEPYGLSFTFNLGWWAFLGEAMAPLYRQQANMLPFADRVIQLYTQPRTTAPDKARVRNPAFETSSYLKGSLIESVLRSAEAVAKHPMSCQED